MSSISSNPQGYLGVLSANPPNRIYSNRAPLSTDTNANIGDIWIYYTVNPAQFFILGNLFGGVATWQDLGTLTAAVQTVTGNDSIAVGPNTAGNINLVGDGSVITVAGNAATNTETIAITGIIPVSKGGTGASTFTAGQLLQGNGTSAISSTNSPTVNSITINNAPVNPTDGTNKAYVDAVVPVSRGGTGNSSFSPYQIIAGGTTSTNPLQQVASTGAVEEILTSQGAGALPIFTSTIAGRTAFSVYLSANIANQTGNGATATVVCDTVYVDKASGYNTTTGIYTIQKTGLYFFGFNTNYGNVTTASIFESVILQNGIQSAKFVNDGSIGGISSGQGVSGSTLINCTVGDQISVTILANGQGANTVSILGGTDGKETEFWGFQIA